LVYLATILRSRLSRRAPYTTLFRSDVNSVKGDINSVKNDVRSNSKKISAIQEKLEVIEKQTAWNTESYNTIHDNISEKVSNLERSEEHTSELQSRFDLVCRLLLEKK